MTNRQKILILGAGAGLILVALGAGFGLPNWGTVEANPDERLKIMQVNVRTAEEVDVYTITRTHTGVVKARRVADLGFERGGKINSLAVQEGDSVVAGDVLAQLDTAILEASHLTAEASIRQAEAVLNELIAGPRIQTKEAARADVAAAEALFQNAQYNAQRRARLWESRSIAREELDEAVSAEKATAARLASLRERLAELEQGTREEQKAAARAGVERLKANLNEVEVAIRQSQLLAPFDGTITVRHLDPGTVVDTGAPVLRLQQRDQLEVWVGLPLDAATELEVGQSAGILIDGERFSGLLQARLPLIDARTRTQMTIFQLPSASAAVVPGQIVKLELTRECREVGFWVPTTALTQGVRGLWSVMIVDREPTQPVVQKRDVEIIHSEIDRSFVRGTLTAGDQIIINGVHRLVVGTPVEPLPATPVAKTPDEG